jgi:nitrate/nitrite transport system substrate-binding protein
VRLNHLADQDGACGSLFDPYDADRALLMRCACGRHHTPIEHGAQAPDPVQVSNDFIEAALVKALLPQESLRRRFLKLTGANAARAAIASVLPVSALQAMAHDRFALEKN